MSQDFEPVIAAVDQTLVNNDLFVVPEANNMTEQMNEAAIEDKTTLAHVAHKTGRGLLRGGEFGVLFAEVTPLNEMMRVAAGGLAIKSGMSPEGVAAVYGGATLAIESTAAVVAARWLSSDRSKKTVDWFNSKLENRGISPDAKFNRLTKAGITFFGGTAVSSTVQFRENPSLEKSEIRKYGLKVSALLAGACAIQGYAVGKGFDAPSPATIGAATAAVGGVFGLGGWAQRRVRSEQTAQGIDGKALRVEAKERRKQEQLVKRQEKLMGVV